MEQLLEEYDSLQQQDLAQLTGNWCESCESLRQELKRIQEEQVQNFAKLKQKIIPTDLLIKKYKSKCDDYDNQTKRLEETTRKLEKTQRQSETLELQLKSSLLETEPLRKSKQTTEAELRTKMAELEDAKNKLICSEGFQQQVQGENRYLTEQLEKATEEKAALKDKLHWYKRTERDEDTIKHLKAEIASLKREVSRLNKENGKLQKKEKSLETKLLESNEKINHYSNMLREHKLMTAAKKSLPYFRSPGKSGLASDSDASFENVEEKDSFLHDDVKQLADESGSSEDDDIDTFLHPSWVFNPMVKCLSPLPPSPACFAPNQTLMTEEEEEEYLSDLAEELESQLMDILSEDDITEVGNVQDKHSHRNEENESGQNTENCIENNGTDNVLVDEYIDKNDKGAKLLEVLVENVTDELDVEEHIEKDALVDFTDSENTHSIGDASIHGATSSNILGETHTDDICKTVLENLVRTISVENESLNSEDNDMDIDQTIYCDDTVLAQCKALTQESPISVNEKRKMNETSISKDVDDKIDSSNSASLSDKETFKSPKSLKERLKDSANVISPVSARQTRSSSKINNKSDLQINTASETKLFKEGHDTQVSTNLIDTYGQNSNLNRSDTGEFTPSLNEIEIPSPISKGKSRFFISDQDNFGTLSDENSNSSDQGVKTLKNKRTYGSANNDPVSTVNDNVTISDRKDNSQHVKEVVELNGANLNSKPLLKRQRAVSRTESTVDNKIETYVSSDTIIKKQSPQMKTKRLTRAKSLPTKWINFQKGDCKTLAEEQAKFDVSKGGYNCDETSQVEKSSMQGLNETTKSYHSVNLDLREMQTNDKIKSENSNSLNDTKNSRKSSPIAKRTRRSSRLLSLSDNNQDQPIQEEEHNDKKYKNTVQNEQKNETETSSQNSEEEKKEENKIDKVKMDDVVDMADKSGSFNTQNKHDSSAPNIDFRGDANSHSLKSINYADDMVIGGEEVSKEDISNTEESNAKATPSSNLEEISSKTSLSSDTEENNAKTSPSSSIEETNAKASISKTETSNAKSTPTRQHSTGFNMHSPGSSESKHTSNSFASLKDSIIEENEMATIDGSNVVPSVILDINDIFSGNTKSDENDNITQIGETSNKTSCSSEDASTVKSHSNSDSLALIDTGKMTSDTSKANDSSTKSDIKHVATDAELMEESLSTKSSPVIWLDSASSASKLTDSRSGSMSPFDSSYIDTPVLSPMPMSPFEIVRLISPLPPSPVPDSQPSSPMPISEASSSLPNSQPLSPLPECDEEMVDNETVVATPSPEASHKAESPPVFGTPETKAFINKEKLEFSPVPTMISPILTPKRMDAIHRIKPAVRNQSKDISQKLCKFISDAPKGVLNVKPKSNLSENVNATKASEIVKTDSVTLCIDKNARKGVQAKLHAKQSTSESTTQSSNEIKISEEKETTMLLSETEGDSRILKPVKVQGENQDALSKEDNKTVTKPALIGGYDNLVATKTKARQAHQPKQGKLPVKKQVPIIEAPVLPVSRKRKSLEQEKDTEQEKKPCKEHMFKRRQKKDAKANTGDNKLMQSFLQSTDSPAAIIDKFEGDSSQDPTDLRLVSTCFECLSRIRNDTLDAVHESCMKDDYLNVIDDWPYLFPVEKQAVELCWLIAHRDTKLMTRSHIMEDLWKRIFDNDHIISISGKKSLCRLFTALCMKAGNIEEARVLFYHIVACGYMNVTSYLVPIISVWPEVLRQKEETDAGMVSVLEFLVLEMLKSQDNDAGNKIKECAMKLCNWAEDREPADSILGKMMRKLQEASVDECNISQVFELQKSIELLSKKQTWSWFYQNFVIRQLQTVSNRWAAKGPKSEMTSTFVCTVLKITGTMMCHFTGGRHFSDVLRHWLLPILRKEQSCQQVRECCIETILEVSCFVPRVMNNLQNWYFMYRGPLRADLVARMKDLRQQYVAKFSLRVEPFTRRLK